MSSNCSDWRGIKGGTKRRPSSCSRAHFTDPNRAEVHNNLGEVLKTSTYQRRSGIVSPGPQARPQLRSGPQQSEQRHYKLGRLDEAIASYQTALSLKPDYAEAYFNLGIALQQQGRLGDAGSSYQQAIHLKPDLLPAYLNMGTLLVELGRWEDAVMCCRIALEKNPQVAALHSNLAAALIEMGSWTRQPPVSTTR